MILFLLRNREKSKISVTHVELKLVPVPIEARNILQNVKNLPFYAEETIPGDA